MYPADSIKKISAFLRAVPNIKMMMKQNQALARVSPMLEQIVQKSQILTQAVLLMSALINIIFLTNYTYNFETPAVVIVQRDPMAWLKETVNYAGFV